jgi:hypothetical protein
MDSGSFYELGAAFPFGSSRFSYEFGISLNELNSLVETPSKAVKYKTEYIGLDNSLLFSIVKTKRIIWDTKLGFGLQTLFFGKQEIGGVLFDLKQFKEFNGLFFRQAIGTQIKIVTSNQFNFSIGYDYNYNVFNTNNTSNQILLINNSQIKFGLYYKFDNKNSENYLNQLNDTNTKTKINSANNSTIDLKNEPDKNSSKTSKNNIVSQLSSSNIPVINTEKNKLDNNSSRIVKNPNNTQPSTSNNSNLKSISVETKTNKAEVNETKPSVGSNKSVITPDLTSTRVETKGSQNNLMVVKQTTNSNSTNSSNKSVNKLLNPSVNGNNQSLKGSPVVTKAILNLSNSNTKLEQVLQSKPMEEANKNLKKVDLPSVKSNTVPNTNNNDVLSAIMSRLKTIEDKLNQIEKKK